MISPPLWVRGRRRPHSPSIGKRASRGGRNSGRDARGPCKAPQPNCVRERDTLPPGCAGVPARIPFASVRVRATGVEAAGETPAPQEPPC